MNILEIEDLNTLYKDGEGVDHELFAEQRSNALLISGDHYTKRQYKFFNRLRENKELKDDQKIRLTKNHTQKIIKTYINNIITYAPGVTVTPHNDAELDDVKAAQQNLYVWEDIKKRHKFRQKTLEWASDFVGIGEVAVKIFWDPFAGRLIGYEAEMDQDEFGASVPKTDEKGDYVKSKKPVFTGDFCFERIFGFNLIRPAEAKSISDAKWLAIRKMVDTKDLKKKVGNDEALLKLIDAGKDETYLVFEGKSGGYGKSDNQTMLREFYFKPCIEYPNGYFYICTNQGVLFHGELPFGVFPIVFTGWDEIPTTPRYHSHVKQLRPYQIEINRASSKMAEHQITLGDDKILVMNGTKVGQGNTIPGVRAITFTGAPPTILPGRNGDQFLSHIQTNISEMYAISSVEEDKVEKNNQLDPYAMLYSSLKQRKHFTLYTDKFEQFLIEICEKTLQLAKHYYNDQMLIPAIGRHEMVNIAEFRSSEPLQYKIDVEAQVEDIETKLGKQLSMTQILQYVGQQLDKETLGKLIRNMPYGATDQMTDDLTLDYDIATNDILALDRGEVPPIGQYDNHAYLIKRLSHRMRQTDFVFLPDQIKQNYKDVVSVHQEMEAENKRELQAAQADFIPTGGYMVACDLYIPDPTQPDKLPKRLRIPSEALQWLTQRVQEQGLALEPIQALPDGAQREIAGMLGQKPQGNEQGNASYQAPQAAEMAGGLR